MSCSRSSSRPAATESSQRFCTPRKNNTARAAGRTRPSSSVKPLTIGGVNMKTPGKDDSAKRFITIGGGKGGVGKSLVASNLAMAMAQAGSRVVLVDCDLGAANQHELFGIDRRLLGNLGQLVKKISSLEEGLTPPQHPNQHQVAGTGASVGAANINHGEKQRIIRRLRALKADVVIVDVGAGVSCNVLDFFEIGGQRLLVITPQVTSIQTAN